MGFRVRARVRARVRLRLGSGFRRGRAVPGAELHASEQLARGYEDGAVEAERRGRSAPRSAPLRFQAAEEAQPVREQLQVGADLHERFGVRGEG